MKKKGKDGAKTEGEKKRERARAERVGVKKEEKAGSKGYVERAIKNGLL
jgi:hypothetical protein